MAVLGHNITASPESVVARGTRLDQPIDYSEFSQDDLNGFVEGVHHLMENYDRKEWLSLFQSMQDEEIENMTPGEALSTFSIMHNPVMEEIASRFNKDAMAFANDVSINLAQIERLQQNAMSVYGAGHLIEKDDLPADKKAQQEDKEKSDDAWETLLELHEERMEEQREEARKRWDEEMHMIGGKKFSGIDLHNLYLFIQDPANFDRFKQELQNDGVSKEEAEKRANKLKRTLELLEKERQGQLSEREKAELERLQQDRQVAEDLQKMKEMSDKTASLDVSQQNAQKWNAETNEFKVSVENDKAQNNTSTHDIKHKLDEMLSLIEKQRTGKLSAPEKKELSTLMEDQDLADLMVEIEQQTGTRQKPTELVQKNAAEITQPSQILTAKLELSQKAESPKTEAAPNSLTAAYNSPAQATQNDNTLSETKAPPLQKIQLAQVSNLDF